MERQIQEELLILCRSFSEKWLCHRLHQIERIITLLPGGRIDRVVWAGRFGCPIVCARPGGVPMTRRAVWRVEAATVYGGSRSRTLSAVPEIKSVSARMRNLKNNEECVYLIISSLTRNYNRPSKKDIVPWPLLSTQCMGGSYYGACTLSALIVTSKCSWRDVC